MPACSVIGPGGPLVDGVRGLLESHGYTVDRPPIADVHAEAVLVVDAVSPSGREPCVSALERLAREPGEHEAVVLTDPDDWRIAERLVRSGWGNLVDGTALLDPALRPDALDALLASVQDATDLRASRGRPVPLLEHIGQRPVFLSHAHNRGSPTLDSLGVRRFLERTGPRAWYSFREGDCRDWQSYLYHALDTSRTMVLLVTPRWLASKWCCHEFEYFAALAQRTPQRLVLPSSRIAPARTSPRSSGSSRPGRRPSATGRSSAS